jgi:hypothetical protein
VKLLSADATILDHHPPERSIKRPSSASARSALPTRAAAVRARCERATVERCRVTFGEKADFGSVMPVLSVDVRWGRAIGWVCKPEVSQRSIDDVLGELGSA